ncbi:methyl-accepting chemotaxis protein [Aromatoleum toluolicum]|uniref:HAMP domain-containing protein n=1 Tax=Aromatoleum toluolicum TaxID=90060 RepID=A0ABX1NLR9_9RHOO|nr:methyl-accepting chemotaxis protein [Aromatoleum toluolicum]NMG00216.1 methyl-accepting chemotaxis protein [Aromatoleum toluolicum]
MRTTLSLKAKLYALAAFALVMIVAIAAMLFYGNASSTEALRRVYEENVIPLRKIQTVSDQLGEVRFRIAGVITDQMPAPGSRRHLAEAREALPQLWADYRRMTATGTDETDELALTAKLEQGLATLPGLFAKLDTAYSSSNDKELLTAILEEDWPPVITSVSKPLAELIALRTQEVEQVYHEAARMERELNRYATILVGGAVVLLAIFTTLIIRAITRPVADVQRALAQVAQGDLTAKSTVRSGDELGEMARAINASLETLGGTLAQVRSGSDRVAEASDNVRTSAQDIHDRAQMQSDEVMKMTAAMEQLTVSVGEISTGSAQVSEAANSAHEAAERGSQLMRESRVATERAQHASADATQAVSALSSSIQQINAISTVIREIADQTNLLALNAAIEAARAGEAGRGFAVVADEVRKLAERTGHSTTEISNIVRGVEQQAASAVQAMRAVDADVAEDADKIGRLEEAFTQIVAAAGRVSSLSEDIAHSTKEQRVVAEQTANGMEAISQAVEHTSATIAHMAAAAEDSAHTAAALRQVVSNFRTA